MSQSVVDVLQNCTLFAEVPARGFQRLAVMARICSFQKGQTIFRDGQPCPGAYVVGSGLVRVYKTAPGGKEHVLHLVGPGNTFAEVAAIGRFRCPATAEAVADTTCALLPADLLQRALEEDHELCLGMMTGLSRWVRHLLRLIEDVVLRDAAGRLARFLLESKPEPNADGAIALPGLKRHVASHLNLTSETFSRVLRRFVEGGLVTELPGGRVQVLQSEKLDLVARGLFPRA